MKKKGVSLVTVLLFMLVATIAATATYKWLTSENRSSASRMWESEAEQSALAGVEAARSWMTYHGNELGAVIKQYFDTDKKSIRLNLESMDQGTAQKFSVAVVGVEVAGTAYKVKIVSTGESRNGSKYNASAVFKVSGLYQVDAPEEDVPFTPTDYAYAYFGATTTYSGDHEATAMLINGNWSGNPSIVKEDFIVTGNVELSGNTIDVGNTMCVGGNLGTQNHFKGKDVYVEGNAGYAHNWKSTETCSKTEWTTKTCKGYSTWNAWGGVECKEKSKVSCGGPYQMPCVECDRDCSEMVSTKYDCEVEHNMLSFSGNITGDAYFNGDIEMGNTEDFVVGGNMTLHGTFKTDLGAKLVTINGDLCIEDGGQVVLTSDDRAFTVEQNVWIPGHNAVFRGNDNFASRSKIILGNKAASNVYIADAYPYSAYKTMRDNTKKFTEPNAWIKKRDYNMSTWNHWGKWNYTSPAGDEKKTPYVDKHIGPAEGGPEEEKKSYYFYYVPEGHTDVTFELFHDDYWKEDIGTYMLDGQRFRNLSPNDNTAEWNYLNSNSNGSEITGSPYCYRSSDSYRPECKVSPWFRSLGTVSNSMPSERLQCAKSVKDYCNNIWQKKAGCDGSSYKVDDMLSTGYDKFVKYANNTTCSAAITEYNGNIVSALNSCYETTKANEPEKLYNKQYMVVQLTSPQKADPTGSFVGKFVLIFEDAIGQQAMAPTEEGSYVMLYLKKGTTGEILQTNSSASYNYFVYTEGDIASIIGNEWKGSFYAKVGNDPKTGCAKIGNINGSTKLTYDQSVLDDMTKSGLVCGNNASETCALPTSGSTSSTETSSGTTTSTGGTVISRGGLDVYHVAVGAQLNVELESQYRTTEKLSQTQNVQPEIMVLPRYVYINKDASGTLTDYFTVMHLNGAVAGNGSVTSCKDGAVPVSGALTASGNLTEGTYTCIYKEGEFTSHFYVTVVGATSTTPSVHFEFPQATDLNSANATSNDVKLVVDQFTTTVSKEFSVDIVIKNPSLSGWTITAKSSNLTEIPGGSNEKVYRYSASVGETGLSETIFTVATGDNPASGSVLFLLQTPENATIGSPAAKSFSIVGKTTIHRGTIEQYCAKYPDHCTDDNAKFASTVEDCSQGGTWVNADGLGCHEVTANEEWECTAGNGSSNPITLTAGSVNSLCELYMPQPSEDNQVVAALDNAENADGYTLYASLKRKRFTLDVDLDGASNAKVTVNIRNTYDGDIESTRECSSSGCSDIMVYSGKYVELIAVKNADKFNHWTCSGSGCPEGSITSSTYRFVMENNYAYTATFNQRDPNCFYADFADVSPVFCPSGSSSQECIDRCEGDHCRLGEGRNGTYPNWLMAYCNSGNNCSEWLEPQIQSGFIHGINSKNSNSGNGTTAPVLNQALAGGDGTMTVSIKTNAEGDKKNSFLNSGIILRSNNDASDYIILNIFGFTKKFGLISYSGGTAARICHITGRSITNSNQTCSDQKPFVISTALGLSQPSPIITNNTVIDLSIRIEGSNLHVDFKYEDGKLIAGLINASVDFDLEKDWNQGLVNGTGHNYVGFSLSDPEFQVGQIGWKADNLTNGGSCSAYPSISCSFAAKYEGGNVPLSEDVQPWIGFSSWFDDHEDCKTSLKYYYNGCDMPSSYYYNLLAGMANNGYCGVAGGSGFDESRYGSDGFYENKYGDDGLMLRPSNNGTYYFKYEGPHGVPKGSGIVRNAGVKVSCLNVDYVNSCGQFNVGTIRECSKSVVLIDGKGYMSADEQELSFASANLRAATAIFDVDLVYDDDYVTVSFIDETGAESHSRSVTKTNKSFEMSSMGDVFGFNPEKIVKVKLSGSNSYTLNAISSSCPNSLGVTCGSASYAGESWNINATVNHASNAEKCLVKVIPTNSSIKPNPEIVSCNTNSNTYAVGDADFYQRLNGGSEASSTETFTVQVFDEDGATTPVDECEVTSQTYSKATVTCSVASYSVIQGLGVPKLTYSIQNCPDYGCYYDVELVGVTTMTSKNPEKIPQTGSTNLEWQPNVNTLTNYLSPGTYSYKVTAHNQDNNVEYDECTTPTFSVVEAVEVNASCRLDGDQIEITVTGANNKDVTLQLYYNDVLGNLITSETVSLGASQQTKTVNLSDHASKFSAGQSYTFAITDGVNSGIPCSGGAYKPTKSLNIGYCPTGYTDQETSGSITFDPSVEGCEDGTCSWSVNNGSVSPSSNYTSGNVKISNLGASSYTLTLTHGSTTKTCTFPVTYKTSSTSDFEVVCSNGDASNLVSQSGKTQNSTISVTPYQVSGCGSSDCHYEVKLGGTTVSNGSNYNGGAISFTGANSAGKKDYTVSIYNPTKSVHKDCGFSVTYEATVPSSCTIIDWNISGGNATLDPTDYSGGCAEIRTNRICTGDVQIEIENCGNKSGTWAGVPFTLNGSGYANFSSNPAPSQTTTLNVAGCSRITKVYMSGCSEVAVASSAPVISNCPSTQISAVPGKTVKLPVGLSNCMVAGGCDYTISGGTLDKTGSLYGAPISFAGESSEGIYNYSLTVENAAGTSSACNFSVKYDNNATVAAVVGQKYEGPVKIEMTHSGTCGIDASSGCSAWPSWVSTSVSCWGSNGQISGNFIVSIPNGEWFKVSNCW